ncbi:RidA family protein [Terrarubrum flagellatum]|uniref:RidA family protein n=1 Tax=Terrirubrum flagellatum TaxID=2895980 RepID=UPI003144F66D
MIRRTSPYGGILHEVVEHQGVLYFGGMVSEDLSLDMGGQARDVFRQLDLLLGQHGSDKTKILSALVFVSDLALKSAFNEEWKSYFAAEHLPARAAVQVGGLGEDVLLEIVFTAAVRSR